MDVSDVNQYLNLQPDNSKYFHYSNAKSPHRIQIRRLSDTATIDEEDDDNWYGEVDISKLGLVYAKLRDPQVILKIQTQLVGASLVATVSEQSYLWPPYRVQNSTRFSIRFRQTNKVQESMIERTLGNDLIYCYYLKNANIINDIIAATSKTESTDDLTSQVINDDNKVSHDTDTPKLIALPWDNVTPRSNRYDYQCDTNTTYTNAYM